MATSTNIDLDAQVHELRHLLDNSGRVAHVSSSTFPLRVWERMFALDRDRRAATSTDDEGGRRSPAGSAPGSQQLEYTTRSECSDTSNSHSHHHGHSSSHANNHVLFQQKLDATKTQMRTCRSGALTSTFMRDLVRSTAKGQAIGGELSSPLKIEDNESNKRRRDSPSPPSPSSDAALSVGKRSPSPATPTTTTIADRNVPVAVLACVTVPPRPSASSRRSPPTAVVDHSLTAALTRANSEGGRSVFSGSGSLRSQPIRPFAPIASMWALPENTAEKKRPVVERHDLPFDVTPANDFRQLPFPLTGLGHSVPYAELQDELEDLLDYTEKLAVRK